MELVELTPLSGALVGLPEVDGLSTEQRKRLTIAVELVANPSIVFMDEPTSGLDARAAAIVMRTVRNIVNTGRTIVCTIHQPSIDIFESFDEVFICMCVCITCVYIYIYISSKCVYFIKIPLGSSWCIFPVSQRCAGALVTSVQCRDRSITTFYNQLFLYCYGLFIDRPLISSVNAAFVYEAWRRAHICWSTRAQVL
jgi:hypothetical protein